MKDSHAVHRNAGTIAALFTLLILGAALLALVAYVMPAALGVVLVVGAIVLFITFHYLVWGWWLTRLKHDAAEWPEDDTPT